MSVIYLPTYTVHELQFGGTKNYPNKEEAMSEAAAFVGNNSWAKPFPDEDTYLFGPGDGTVSVQVRQDVRFERDTA